MELLLSNIPPLKPENRSFAECVMGLINKADYMQIASGYISTESLTEIKKIIESNERPRLDLMIGMHYFDGISRPQYEAAVYLNDFLSQKEMGSVSIATTFRFHGKMYSFKAKNEVFASVMGSSNLGSITDIHRNFESDILVTESPIVQNINDFIENARNTIAQPISVWHPEKFIENNPLLEDHESVKKVDGNELSKIQSSLSGTAFKIPLKATDKHKKSNLNVYFGKGRQNMSTGLIKPRNWYEVELIVPKSITDDPKYPKAGYPETESIITVYTDDGWKFECKISGDYSKNFRSNNDLKILGKWIKGRLESSGVLQIGQPVTEEVLHKYGRNNFELKATSDPKVWMLDFGV